MIPLLVLLQAAPAATVPAAPPKAPAVAAPWTPVAGNASMTARATSHENNGRLAIRCDTRADKVVSIQFVPNGIDIGQSPPPGRPVSLTIDGATPLIANWEFPGRGALEREDAAVTTIAAAFAHARTIKLHTTDAAGAPIDATFDGPPSAAGITQVLGACGYTLGQVPVRQPAPQPSPSATPR